MTMTAADADLGYSVHRRSVPGDYNLFFTHSVQILLSIARGLIFGRSLDAFWLLSDVDDDDSEHC